VALAFREPMVALAFAELTVALAFLFRLGGDE
jgi:hypothetical protein